MGTSHVATTAALYFKSSAGNSWIATANTVLHTPRENDATLQEALTGADIVVCMGKHTFDELEKRFRLDARKTIVWNEDRYNVDLIQRRCQALVAYIGKEKWIDAVDKEGMPIGLELPVNWICDRGYWHHGVHVILMTRERGAVLEVRSKDVVTNPGSVDVTLGGFVDAGEEPLHAAVRELKEELGITVDSSALVPLDTRPRSAWHPLHKKVSRSIMHAYLVVIDEHHVVFRPEFSEVAGVALCTAKQLRDLLHGKRIEGVGRISTSVAYYNDIVRLARRQLKTLNAPRRKRKKTIQ